MLALFSSTCGLVPALEKIEVGTDPDISSIIVLSQ
jgi:hypothetical protein